MNLRILKKLSKKAAPLVKVLCPDLDHFVTGLDEGDCDVYGMDRKHWVRHGSSHGDRLISSEIITQPKCRRGTRYPYLRLWQPGTPMRGTIEVGKMSGYYEPEWEGYTAWKCLADEMTIAVTDWVEDGTFDDLGIPNRVAVMSQRLRNPADILRLARAKVEAKAHG